MKNLPLLIGTIVGTLILVIGVAFAFSGNNQPSNLSQEAKVVDQAVLLEGSRLEKGAGETAAVTIVEFGDFQCPACAATAPLVEQVYSQYPGQIRLVYRHFPLNNIHPNAQYAAQFAEAAKEQDAFWPVHDILYERQEEWANLRQADLKEKFVEYAQELRLDTQKLTERIDAPEIKEAVNADTALAGQIGVNSTPTFFVNGRQTTAPQLLTAVESALLELESQPSSSPSAMPAEL